MRRQHNHLQKWVGLPSVFKDFPRHIPSGLWTTQTLTLLQRLACGPTQEPPEAFYRRENIDFLRRTVILLEGNPAAIELVVPEFKKVNYDGEAIFHKLMYGVCETPVNHMDVMPKCRFVRSMCDALVSHSFIDFQATLIRAYLFGPFWTLMPTDLTNYFHFIYHGCGELVEQMREHWPEVETKLFKAGILTYATITRRNGQEIPCYHVHPLFTIMARSCFGETQWMLVRAAFIRQALLWDLAYMKRIIEDGEDNKADPQDSIKWAKVEWDATGPQNDDHIFRWQAIAVGWSVQDVIPKDANPAGRSMLDWLEGTYGMISDAVRFNPRQARLFTPHIRAYLRQAYRATNLSRLHGIPTLPDLASIIDNSWQLYRLEHDDGTGSAKSAILTSALDLVDRWKTSVTPPSSAVLPPAQEVTWFRLRHAQAFLAEGPSSITSLRVAKSLHERNLSTNPATTDQGMLNIIRRQHLESLDRWAWCVFRLAIFEGKLDEKQIQANMAPIVETLGSKPGGLWRSINKSTTTTEDLAVLDSVRVRDQLGYALAQEPEAISKFGSFATALLDLSTQDMFSDIFLLPSEVGKVSETQRVLQYMQTWKRGGGRGMLPEGKRLRFELRLMEAWWRLHSGDSVSAAKVMQPEMKSETESLTTSTGWEREAFLHHHMYDMLVCQTDTPDHKKGLTHLKEWWKLHRGVGISKREQAYGQLKLATSYHALGRVSEAARAVISIVEILQSFEEKDGFKGDVSFAREWFLAEIGEFDKLDVFLDSRVVMFSGLAGVAELTLRERVMMYQIMTQAKEIKAARDRCDELVRRARDALEKSRAILERAREDLEGHNGADGILDKRVEDVSGLDASSVLYRTPSFEGCG